MSDLDLEPIKARLAAGTEGAWQIDPTAHDWVAGVRCCHCQRAVADTASVEIAEFVAHAPEDIDTLIAEVERLRFEPGPACPIHDPGMWDDPRNEAGECICPVPRAVFERMASEVERLRERVGSCICDRNPETTDGPSEDCPQHGRRYAEWVERADLLAERLANVEALYESTFREPSRYHAERTTYTEGWDDGRDLLLSDLRSALDGEDDDA